MKKVGVIILLLMMLSFSLSASPTAPIGAEDTEEFQEAIDNYVPIDDSGELNLSGYKPVKSKAEEKIDKINLWLAENAKWLKAVFGMVPSITLLFFTNLYLMLFLITNLILNAKYTFSFFPGLDKKITDTSEISWAHILGVGLFLILHITKATLKIATALGNQINYHWHKTWEVVTPASIIILILLIVGLIVLFIYFPQVFKAIKIARDAKKERKGMSEQDKNRKILSTIVDSATKNS